MEHRHAIRDERGQAMAEFAIVLPLLVVLLLGVLQFGLVFNRYLTLTDAVRAGARVAAVSRSADDPAAAATAAVRGSAVNLDQDDLDVTITPAAPWQPGASVTVTAKYPYSINLLGWVVSAGDLTSTTTERVE